MSQPDIQRQIENIKHDILQDYNKQLADNLRVSQELSQLRTLVQDNVGEISNLKNEVSKLRREVQILNPSAATAYQVQSQDPNRGHVYYNQTAEKWVHMRK